MNERGLEMVACAVVKSLALLWQKTDADKQSTWVILILSLPNLAILRTFRAHC